MIRYTVSTKRPYDIIIGENLLEKVGELLSELDSPKKICLITDSRVNELYAPVVMDALNKAGYQTCKIVFPEGEHSKNMTTYTNVIEAMAEDGLSRSDLIVALGGGVVGDLAGFVAATYMRGISCVQIPTTYLACVDSSVGGKTGINLLSGKNLAGAFWQPSMVICDYGTFKTLPEEELMDGIAEAVKSGMISEAGLIDRVVKSDYEYVIERCVSIKKSVVEADERDTGMRQLLNFGHTVGHSIEKLSEYSVSHGHAVAMGMVAEARAAARMGLTEFDASAYLTEIFEKMGFNLTIPYSAEDLYRYALTDKKIKGDSIAMTVPEAIGKCRLQKITLDELEKFMEFAAAE